VARDVDGVVAVAATEAECEVVVHGVVLGPSALPTLLRLHFLVPLHQLSTVATLPVGLLADWIGLAPLLTDVLPIRLVVMAHAVNTLTVEILLTCKVAIVHSDPPFWPPLFLGATCNYARNKKKVNPMYEATHFCTFRAIG